jgi:hypothetical protein
VCVIHSPRPPKPTHTERERERERERDASPTPLPPQPLLAGSSGLSLFGGSCGGWVVKPSVHACQCQTQTRTSKKKATQTQTQCMHGEGRCHSTEVVTQIGLQRTNKTKKLPPHATTNKSKARPHRARRRCQNLLERKMSKQRENNLKGERSNVERVFSERSIDMIRRNGKQTNEQTNTPFEHTSTHRRQRWRRRGAQK